MKLFSCNTLCMVLAFHLLPSTGFAIRIGCDSAVCNIATLKSCVQNAANAKCGGKAVRVSDWEIGEPTWYEYQRCESTPSGEICQLERHCQQQAWSNFRCH